jgi:colicin import membrane protein
MKATGLWLALIVAVAPPALVRAQGKSGLNRVTRVQIRGEAVEITASRPPSFTTFNLADPPRLVIDVAEAVFAGVPGTIAGGGAIAGIKTVSYGSGSAAIARVVIGLERELETDIETSGSVLVVRVLGDGSPAVASGGAERAAQEKAAAEAQKRAQDDRAAQEKGAADAQKRAQDDRAAQEKATREAAARAEADRRARAESEKASREEAARQAEAQRKAAEVAAKRAGAERAQREKAERERAEQERAERRQSSDREKVEREKAEETARREARARAEEQRTAREEAAGKAREERIAQQKAEREAAETAKREVAETAKREVAETAKRMAQQKAERMAQQKAEREAAETAKRGAAETAKREAAETAKREAEERRKRDQVARLEAQRRAQGAAAEGRRVSEGPRVVSAETREGGRRTLALVGFRPEGHTSRVFIRTDSPAQFEIREADGKTIVVALPNTRIGSPNNARFLDTSFFDTPVQRVTPTEVGRDVHVEIKLKTAVSYRARQDGADLVLEFQGP